MTQSDTNGPIALDRAYWSKVAHKDLYAAPLWPTVASLVEWNQGKETYETAQLRTAADMPIGLRHYFLIMRFDGLWGNGGMQAVALGDDAEGSWKLITGAAEAFRFHGLHNTASVLDELVSVAKIVAPRLDVDLPTDADEAELEALWNEIDAFNDRYEAADAEIDVYARIVEHAHANPELYVPTALEEQAN